MAVIKDDDKSVEVGDEIPTMVAEGDLNVEYKAKDAPVKKLHKVDTPLPKMGAKFMLDGHEYKVIYINEGKHRFSCEPCKGVY